MGEDQGHHICTSTTNLGLFQRKPCRCKAGRHPLSALFCRVPCQSPACSSPFGVGLEVPASLLIAGIFRFA